MGRSWLNRIETWFGIITTQALRRGTFGSLRLLIDTINAYIESWNQNAEPFTRNATPKEIVAMWLNWTLLGRSCSTRSPSTRGASRRL